MRKIFLGVYNPSIILTYIGTFCSLCGIGLFVSNQQSNFENTMTIATILLIISGVCDMFDGTVARLCKRTDQEKEFGVQLDSLADTISFVAFPATILIFSTGARIDTLLIAFFYVFAGIMRLGWFNVTAEENKGVFYGLPVTLSALIFPVLYTAMSFLNVQKVVFDIVSKVVFTIVAFLFISNFKLNKPKTAFRILLAALAIATIVILLIL